MRIITYILIIALIIIGVTFAALNHAPVNINYYLGERTLPLSFLLVLSFAVGSLIGISVGIWIFFKLKLKNYRLHQQLRIAEKEIENLRAIPLQDRH